VTQQHLYIVKNAGLIALLVVMKRAQDIMSKVERWLAWKQVGVGR
jgi:hypothetical protein